jgi:hypothetical protein
MQILLDEKKNNEMKTIKEMKMVINRPRKTKRMSRNINVKETPFSFVRLLIYDNDHRMKY